MEFERIDLLFLESGRTIVTTLVQVGDMRAAWKKMKAAGITSDIGLRYLPHPVAACLLQQSVDVGLAFAVQQDQNSVCFQQT